LRSSASCSGPYATFFSLRLRISAPAATSRVVRVPLSRKSSAQGIARIESVALCVIDRRRFNTPIKQAIEAKHSPAQVNDEGNDLTAAGAVIDLLKEAVRSEEGSCRCAGQSRAREDKLRQTYKHPHRHGSERHSCDERQDAHHYSKHGAATAGPITTGTRSSSARVSGAAPRAGVASAKVGNLHTIAPSGSHDRVAPNGSAVRVRSDGRPADVHNAQRGMDIHHNLAGGAQG
jgi:hypothetical protein